MNLVIPLVILIINLRNRHFHPFHFGFLLWAHDLCILKFVFACENLYI